MGDLLVFLSTKDLWLRCIPSPLRCNNGVHDINIGHGHEVIHIDTQYSNHSYSGGRDEQKLSI